MPTGTIRVYKIIVIALKVHKVIVKMLSVLGYENDKPFFKMFVSHFCQEVIRCQNSKMSKLHQG